MLQRVLHGLIELLAPPRCAACNHHLGAEGDGFCAACAPLLERAPESLQHEDVRIAYVYGGPLADAIQRLKYEGASYHAPALAGLLTPLARELEGEVDLVTAVPLHPRRLRERGYNQSALLARPLARALDVPCRPHWLRRVRAASTQVGSGEGAPRSSSERCLLGEPARARSARCRRGRREDQRRHAGRARAPAARAGCTLGTSGGPRADPGRRHTVTGPMPLTEQADRPILRGCCALPASP